MATDKRNKTSEEMKAEVEAKIAQFSEQNKPLAEKVHQLIMEAAPTLHPRLWYGMPGYAKTKDSAVLCFFREDEKYMTFGFTESVNITPEPNAESKLMPCAWFFTDIDSATETHITKIVHSVAA